MEKKELLAKYLEIEDLDQIEESSYDDSLFIVNPHTKKVGASVEEKRAKVNLVKTALFRVGLAAKFARAEFFNPNVYDDLSKLFYKQCEDLTKIGIHDLVNTLYFLCGGSKDHWFQNELDKCNSSRAHDLALMQEYRDLYDGEEIEDDREEIEVSDGEYMVLTDAEADRRFEESCRSYIDDCMEIPESMRYYFDEDKFIKDARCSDGRGPSLAGYDGCEHEIKDPDSEEWYFIYRTN